MQSALMKLLCSAMFVVPSPLPAQSGTPFDIAAPGNIGEAIARVHLVSDGDERFKEIQRIAIVLRGDSSGIVERDVIALAALMRDPDDGVRRWAAVALGNIGPRAAAAVPALQAALPEVDCLWAPASSRSGIIFALRRIGVEPRLADCPPADISSPPRAHN